MIRKLVIHRVHGIQRGVLEGFSKVNVFVGEKGKAFLAPRILDILYLSGVCSYPCKLVLTQPEVVIDATVPYPQDIMGRSPISYMRDRYYFLVLPWRVSSLTPKGEICVELTNIPPKHPYRKFYLRPLEGHRPFNHDDRYYISLFSVSDVEKIPREMVPPLLQEHYSNYALQRWYYVWEYDMVLYDDGPTDPINRMGIWITEGYQPDVNRVAYCERSSIMGKLYGPFLRQAFRYTLQWNRHMYDVFPELKWSLMTLSHDKLIGATRVSITPSCKHKGEYTDFALLHAAVVLASLTILANKVDRTHPGLFLWENPEFGISTGYPIRLMKKVMDIVANLPIQVFIASVTSEVADYLEPLKREVALDPDEIRVFSLNDVVC